MVNLECSVIDFPADKAVVVRGKEHSWTSNRSPEVRVNDMLQDCGFSPYGDTRRTAQWEGSSVLGQLWDAILEDRVVVHYQPQYEFKTGRIMGVEALARFQDESGQLYFPDRFIVAAEESGMVVPLGRAVIQHAVQDLASWRADGLTLDRAAINLSAHQLDLDHNLVSFIGRSLSKAGLSWGDVEFELTERQLLETGSPGMFSLAAMIALGARLALDDFGTGFSSISYLNSLEVHTIKLDRDMIRRMPLEKTAGVIARHMLNLAADLEMEVVAEGIETDEQYEYLAGTSCHYAQGFKLARPMPTQALSSLLRADGCVQPRRAG